MGPTHHGLLRPERKTWREDSPVSVLDFFLCLSLRAARNDGPGQNLTQMQAEVADQDATPVDGPVPADGPVSSFLFRLMFSKSSCSWCAVKNSCEKKMLKAKF